jgi:hypothetical protein
MGLDLPGNEIQHIDLGQYLLISVFEIKGQPRAGFSCFPGMQG